MVPSLSTAEEQAIGTVGSALAKLIQRSLPPHLEVDLRAAAPTLTQFVLFPEVADWVERLARPPSVDRAVQALQVLGLNFHVRSRDGSNADTRSPGFNPDALPFVVADNRLRAQAVSEYTQALGGSSGMAAYLDQLALLWVEANEHASLVSTPRYLQFLYAGTRAAITGQPNALMYQFDLVTDLEPPPCFWLRFLANPYAFVTFFCRRAHDS